jgi:hypothetical protein
MTTDYNDDLDLDDPFSPAKLREIAAKVQDALKAQKTGPLPSWIKAPKPKHKEESVGR